jgi:hypothetical protein
MATIIDTLIIELGFDTKKLSDGSKKATSSVKDLESKSNKAGKSLQDDANKNTQAFSKFRNEILSLAAAFVSVSGIKAFSERITTSDAALGRMANNIGMSSTELSAWTMAADKAGGTAEGMAGSIKGLVERVQHFKATGEGAEGFKWFTALGIDPVKADATESFLQAADKLSAMKPAQAQEWGRGMGMDEGTINVLMQGRKEVEKLLAEQKKLAIVTEEDSKNAQDRKIAWNKLQNQFEDIGRTLLNDLQPIIMQLSTDFGEWIKKIDPKEIEEFFRVVISVSKEAVNAVGGITNAVEILMGLWVGSKFLSMMNGIKALTGGLTGAGSALGKLGLVGAAFEAGNAIGEEINKHLSTETKDAIGGTVAGMVDRVKSFGGKVKETASDVMKFFEGKGWTPEQAAGITANLQQESGFNPKAKGDSGKAAGVAQWHPDRQANFKKFSGKDIKDSSLEEQLSFVDYELRQGTEKKAGKMLMSAKSAFEAGGIVSSKYERPAAKEKEMQMRGLSAANIQQARNSTTNTTNNARGGDVSVGQVVVNTQATNATEIAKDIGGALKSYSYANQAIQGVS